jgi:ribonuclease P protein component
MLPRKHRLTAAKDFARVFKAKRAWRSQNIDLRIGPNELGIVRVGFSVGVKVAKRAVVRNLLKRRLREIVRRLTPQILPGHDLLFSAKPGSQELSFSELTDSVAGLLSRSSLIRSR